MKLERKNNFKEIFSSTEIPDMFFNEYLNLADGNAVKVYLYACFSAKTGRDISIKDISDNLSIPHDEVKKALEYWENNELIIKKPDGYILVDLQEKELNKLYSPKVTSSIETAEKVMEDKARTACIESINAQFFSGVMNPTWFTDIDLWFNKYGFDEDAMFMLFSYSSDRNALNRNYIQAVAERMV